MLLLMYVYEKRLWKKKNIVNYETTAIVSAYKTEPMNNENARQH